MFLNVKEPVRKNTNNIYFPSVKGKKKNKGSSSTYLDDVNLLSAVVPHFKLLHISFDVLCDPHSAHLNTDGKVKIRFHKQRLKDTTNDGQNTEGDAASLTCEWQPGRKSVGSVLHHLINPVHYNTDCNTWYALLFLLNTKQKCLNFSEWTCLDRKLRSCAAYLSMTAPVSRMI